jgi:hypothetical protein
MIDVLSPASLRNGLRLLALKFKTYCAGIKEFLKTAFHFYGNSNFMRADLSLLGLYLFNSPYRISKRFLQEKGVEDIYAYGETPINTMETIVKECGITKEDHVFELGSGRGRVCFWLGTVIKAQVTGIDNVPEFVARAGKIQKRLGLSNIRFIEGDILTAPLEEGSVFYLFGTAYSDEFLEKLTQRFEGLKKGTRFITISFPLEDYSKSGAFEMLKRFPVSFPWGTTDAYYQMRK